MTRTRKRISILTSISALAIGVMLAGTLSAGAAGTMTRAGIGSDGYGGSVSYTEGYSDGRGGVMAGIRILESPNWYYDYDSENPAKLLASVRAGTLPQWCDHVHSAY